MNSSALSVITSQLLLALPAGGRAILGGEQGCCRSRRDGCGSRDS